MRPPQQVRGRAQLISNMHISSLTYGLCRRAVGCCRRAGHHAELPWYCFYFICSDPLTSEYKNLTKNTSQGEVWRQSKLSLKAYKTLLLPRNNYDTAALEQTWLQPICPEPYRSRIEGNNPLPLPATISVDAAQGTVSLLSCKSWLTSSRAGSQGVLLPVCTHSWDCLDPSATAHTWRH